MLTHTVLFGDICRHLVSWCSDLPQTPTSTFTRTLQNLPKANHYAVELQGCRPEIHLLAFDDPDYPIGHVLTPNTHKSKDSRLREATSVATQVYMQVRDVRSGSRDDAHTLYLQSLLANLLLRRVSEDLTIRIDIHTYRTGFRLGVIGIGRFGRTLVNECFDFTESGVDVTEFSDSLFVRYHRKANGDQHYLYYRDIASLEAITHLSSRVTYIPGSWPLVAFTVLSGEGGQDCPGLGLKTPKGWVVLVRESHLDHLPYRCHHIPSVYQQQYDISPAMLVGEESVALLLTALHLHHCV